MTANGGHKGRGGRTTSSSARLSIGPEDDWRSWSQLPDDDSQETEADTEPTVEDLESGLRGSMMMVVGTATDPAQDATDAALVTAPAHDATDAALVTDPAPATDPAPNVGPAAAPAAVPPSAKAPTPKAAPPVPKAPPVAVKRSPIADGPTVAPPALPRRNRANLPPPADVTTELPVVAADAPRGVDAPRPTEAEGDAALAAGLPVMEMSFVAPADPATPPPPRRPVDSETTVPAANPVAAAPPLAIFDPSPRTRRKNERSDEPAIVLLSGPEVAPAPERRPSSTTSTALTGRSGGIRPEPRQGPSISSIVAEALSMLERQVAQQAEQTESLLDELESHYADEIARLDGRVHLELSALEAGVPKEFEDRVHASFMQLVERLERLEHDRGTAPEPVVAPAPAAVPVAERPSRFDPGADAAIAFAMEEQNRVAALVEELARRQAQAEADHLALAEQNMQLAEAQQLVASGAQRATDQLESALAHMAEMAQRVETLMGSIPEVERRVVGLEQHAGQQLELLRARVDVLAERFPAVEESVELIHRQSDAIADLRGTMDQFRAALDHEMSQVHLRLDGMETMRSEVVELQERTSRQGVEMGELSGRIDGTDERIDANAAATAALNADFLRLQAETDRRSSVTESRVLDLEDAIGGEVGVERNLLLDRIEEMERGLYELNPDQFVRRDELAEPVPPSDDPFSNGPGH